MESEKFLKGDGGSMVQGQVFLKWGGPPPGGGEGLALSLFNFSRFIIFTFRIFLPWFAFAKLCYALEEKLCFTATIILCNKVILR